MWTEAILPRGRKWTSLKIEYTHLSSNAACPALYFMNSDWCTEGHTPRGISNFNRNFESICHVYVGFQIIVYHMLFFKIYLLKR